MTDHELKVWPMYFRELERGVKTFEYRRDDREPRFAVGDVLRLREWGGASMEYSGAECVRLVTYVARTIPIPEGFCVMSVVPMSMSEAARCSCGHLATWHPRDYCTVKGCPCFALDVAAVSLNDQDGRE